MEKSIFDTKYLVQTVLRRFPRKSLRPGKLNMYQIYMDIFDDTLDAICFYVPKTDVEYDDTEFCTILLTQKEYEVSYYSKDEDVEMVKERIHRFVITDAYYHAHPELQYHFFDLMCVQKNAVYEAEDVFTITFLSTNIVKNTPITFSVLKKNLHWVLSDEKTKYAHVDLKQRMYRVTFKNKQTRWRESNLDVTSDAIIADFLNSKRAAYEGVSPKTYMAFLEQEYVFSRLFPKK